LGAEEMGAGRQVTPSQDDGQVGIGHLPGEAQSRSAPAPPAAGFIRAVGVVARRARIAASTGRRAIPLTVAPVCGGSGSGRWRRDLGTARPGASQRRDRKPHRVTLGGRPAGAPQGHLQGCARRIWGSETTGRAGRGRCRRTAGRSGDGHGCRRAREGARGWSWWWRAVMWAMSRVGSVSGDRSGLGGGQLVEDAARAGAVRAPSAAPPGYTRPLRQRHPEAHDALDAH
jgi:hypothetical protein